MTVTWRHALRPVRRNTGGGLCPSHLVLGVCGGLLTARRARRGLGGKPGGRGPRAWATPRRGRCVRSAGKYVALARHARRRVGHPSGRTLRTPAGVGVWPVPGVSLRQGIRRGRWGRWPWRRPSAGHAMPSCSPRGCRRGVTGSVASARCPASLPRGTVVSPSMPGAGVGPRRGDAAVRQEVADVSQSGPVRSREGRAWASCRGVGPTAPRPRAGAPAQGRKAGRRGAIPRVVCHAHAAPN